MCARTYVVFRDVVLPDGLIVCEGLCVCVCRRRLKTLARKAGNYARREIDFGVLLSPAICYLYLRTNIIRVHIADGYMYIRGLRSSRTLHKHM